MVTNNTTKLIAAFFLGVLTACGAAVSADLVQNFIMNQSVDGPLELIVKNQNSGMYAITEIRAINDSGCAIDMGATGSNYSDPKDSTVAKNTGFLVSESTCDGMVIKSNKGPLTLAAHESGNIIIREDDRCPTKPGLCVDESGILWFVGKNGTMTVLANP